MLLHVLLLCAFAVATTEFILVGLLPAIADDLGVSLAKAGLLVTAYMLVGTLGGPLAAVVTRRLPRRGLLAATMALALGAAALSARADTYGLLLGARLGSALAQALFVAVASQVAMMAVPPARQTAAVARVFNGFALATVAGLPLGTLVGQRFGWHAAFDLVAVLAGVGLAGIVVFCPPLPRPAAEPVARSLAVLRRPPVLLGLLVTGLALTGFVTAFTYVAPLLRQITGLDDVGTSLALVIYGLGTLGGTALAGRIAPERIAGLLPLPLGALAAVLLSQGVLLHSVTTAMLSLFLLGASAFVLVPLLQTWLMRQVGEAAAGLIAATNISVAALAAAVGAALGSAVIASGVGLAWIGPIGAVPVLAALGVALLIGRRAPRPSPVPTAPAVPTRCPVDAACPG